MAYRAFRKEGHFNRNTTRSIQEDVFENVELEMVPILLWPQYIENMAS